MIIQISSAATLPFVTEGYDAVVALWQSAGWTFRQDIRVMSIIINEGNK